MQVLDLSCVDAYSANYILGRTLKTITDATANENTIVDKSSIVSTESDTAVEVNDKYGITMDSYQGTYVYTNTHYTYVTTSTDAIGNTITLKYTHTVLLLFARVD
jgi:hypothetical protein